MIRLIGVAVLAGTALLALARRRWLVITVSGPSMLPTYRTGDRVLVRRVRPDGLRNGQVVVFQPPGDDFGWDRAPLVATGASRRPWYIKRIAALPADPLPGEAAPAVGAPPGTPVPPGSLVVFGDGGPLRSVDSRQWGYVPADRVLGVVVRRLSGPGRSPMPVDPDAPPRFGDSPETTGD